MRPLGPDFPRVRRPCPHNRVFPEILRPFPTL